MNPPMHRHTNTAGAAVFVVILLLQTTPSSSTKNITAILSADPRFSTFNTHLTSTNLTSLLNSEWLNTTVCAIDNTAMSTLLSLNPSNSSLRLILFSLLYTPVESDTGQLCSTWASLYRPSNDASIDALFFLGIRIDHTTRTCFRRESTMVDISKVRRLFIPLARPDLIGEAVLPERLPEVVCLLGRANRGFFRDCLVPELFNFGVVLVVQNFACLARWLRPALSL